MNFNQAYDNEIAEMEAIEYYVFDSIESIESNNIATWKGERFEVFHLSADDTEAELIKNGFVKCDAPGTETFVVEKEEVERIEKMNNI